MSEKFGYPLTPEQVYYYKYQKEYPDSTMLNLYPLLFKFNDWVDLKKISECIIKNISLHPAFSTIIEEHNGVLTQKYIPDLIKIEIEKMSESEFQILKDEMVQPFNFNDALVSLRLFETEKGKYFFYDVHQIICDAYSKNIWMFDLDKMYMGKEIQKDNWFLYLEERERAKFSPHYQESKKYYENLYGRTEWSGYPRTDFSGEGKNEQGLLLKETGISENDLGVIKNYNLNLTEFFCVISLLSTAMFNNAENVMHTWTYKGRWKKLHHNVVGAMIMDMPVALKLKGMSVKEIFKSVREQVKGNLLYRDYPYMSLDEKILSEDQLCVINQGEEVYSGVDNPKITGILGSRIELHGGSRGGGGSENVLDVDTRIDNNGYLKVLFDYAAHQYKTETMNKFAEIFNTCAHKLLRMMKEDKCDIEVLF